MNQQIIISCIVCSYNRERYIADAIESLMQQTLSASLYEVIIVDNNSKDNTASICSNLLEKYSATHHLKYVVETNQGLSFARNRGIAEASSNLICYIDDDAIAKPDFLKNITDFFAENITAVGVGGKIIPKYVHGEPKWMSHYMEGLVSKVDNGEKMFQYDGKKFPIGCNMTYKKEVLMQIGMFDTDLGRKGDSGEASEEKDVFLKLFAKGYPIYYLPNVVVDHVIENTRLEYNYIKKISAGIGRSEHLRIAKKGTFAKWKKFAELIFKFGAAIVLATYHLLRLEPAKSRALIQFRINVFRGWFSL
jgi:glucosyl-dolichyl phosphate glucuronosyltransferase